MNIVAVFIKFLTIFRLTAFSRSSEYGVLYNLMRRGTRLEQKSSTKTNVPYSKFVIRNIRGGLLVNASLETLSFCMMNMHVFQIFYIHSPSIFIGSTKHYASRYIFVPQIWSSTKNRVNNFWLNCSSEQPYKL